MSHIPLGARSIRRFRSWPTRASTTQASICLDATIRSRLVAQPSLPCMNSTKNSRKSTKLRRHTSDSMYVIHDFVFTPSFYVLILNPAAVKWFNLIKIGLGFQPLMKAIGQNDNNKMRAVFIPRKNCETVKEPLLC